MEGGAQAYHMLETACSTGHAAFSRALQHSHTHFAAGGDWAKQVQFLSSYLPLGLGLHPKVQKQSGMWYSQMPCGSGWYLAMQLQCSCP